MFNTKGQEHGKFIFNSTDKKRKQPDSNVLSESVVALLSVTQQYRQNLKKIEDELNDIKREEAEIHNNFRKQLLKNQKRLNEFKNSESIKRNAYNNEYQKKLEELNKKYKNQLKDITVCTKCYNNVTSKTNICIGCQKPLCKNCQDDVVTWGCNHINSNIHTDHMDLDNNKKNNMLITTMKIHDTQVSNLDNLVYCKECITSILTKRCEKCFRRLCQNNKNHSICHICFDKSNMNGNNNSKRRDILLCDACKEAIRQYQKSDKKIKNYTYIGDEFLFYTCANPSCHTCLCKICTEKEGAVCHKCGDVYCSQCQKKNTFIKIIVNSMNDSSKENTQQQSYWECLSCIKESQMKKTMLMNEKSKQYDETKINFEEKADEMNTDNNGDSNNSHTLSSIPKSSISIVNDESNDIQQLNDSNITLTETTSLTDININTNEKEVNTSNSTIVVLSTTTTTATAISESININNNNNNNNDDDENSNNNNMTVQGSINTANKEIKKIDELSEKLVNFNNKENIPLSKNNTKKNIKEIETKLNSDRENNTNKNENVTIKPLEKALSNVTLE